MSRLTIFAVTLIVALAAFPVQAQTHDLSTPTGYCNFLAGYAEAAATDRDAGVQLYQSIGIANGIKHERIRADVLWVIQFVYAPANLTAERAASGIFEICWANYGE